jgi:hypothetical protein
MIEIFYSYITAQAFILFWFYSPLKTSLYKLLTGKFSLNNDDFDTYLLCKNTLFKVFTCTFCLGFWTSLITSIYFNTGFESIVVSWAFSITCLYLFENILIFLKRS